MNRHLTALVAAGAVLLAACGGGGTNASSTTSTSQIPAPTTTTTTAPRTVRVTTASWSLPAPVSREVALTDGTGLIVLGGQDARHVSTAAAERIDPATGSVTPLGSLNPAVHDAAGVRLGVQNLVIAGGTPPARATVQAVAAGAPARSVGQLPGARTDHVAVLLDGTAFTLGGADASEAPVADVFASTDGATWRPVGRLAEPVRYPAVAAVGHAIFLFGGVGPGRPDSTSVQRYDPSTGTTQVVGRLPGPLSHASAIVLGGVVFVLGGFAADQPSTQVLRFDPASGQVTAAGTLPAPVTDGAAVVIGDAGYLAGGEGPGRATTASVQVLRAG